MKLILIKNQNIFIRLTLSSSTTTFRSKGRRKCIKHFIKHNEILMFDAFDMDHNFEKKRKEDAV